MQKYKNLTLYTYAVMLFVMIIKNVLISRARTRYVATDMACFFYTSVEYMLRTTSIACYNKITIASAEGLI